jgi:hypothetical protein
VHNELARETGLNEAYAARHSGDSTAVTVMKAILAARGIPVSNDAGSSRLGTATKSGDSKPDPTTAPSSVGQSSHLQIAALNPSASALRVGQSATVTFSLLDTYRESSIQWHLLCDYLQIDGVNATSTLSYNGSKDVTGNNARVGDHILVTLTAHPPATPPSNGLTGTCYLNVHTLNSGSASNSSDSRQVDFHIVAN